MLPFMNKKKAVTTILGGMDGDKEEVAEPGQEDDAYLAIAKDVLRAVRKDSAADLKDALMAFCNQMEAEEPEEVGEEG